MLSWSWFAGGPPSWITGCSPRLMSCLIAMDLPLVALLVCCMWVGRASRAPAAALGVGPDPVIGNSGNRVRSRRQPSGRQDQTATGHFAKDQRSLHLPFVRRQLDRNATQRTCFEG